MAGRNFVVVVPKQVYDEDSVVAAGTRGVATRFIYAEKV